MRGTIIKGIFSLLLLLVTTTAMAETVVIDFTGTVDDVEGASPLLLGDVMSGHIEFNTGDLVPAESSDVYGSSLRVYRGANSFGSASATPSGWTFPAVPGVHSIDVLVFDNYFSSTDSVYLDTLDIEVRYDTGEHFGFFIMCDANEGLVDLNAAEIIDFEKLSALTTTPYELEFWAHGELLPSGYGVSWKATGPVTTISTPAVPVPAAAWLFGSGLLGLVGVVRRKRVAA